jgi:hypothetical protein
LEGRTEFALLYWGKVRFQRLSYQPHAHRTHAGGIITAITATLVGMGDAICSHEVPIHSRENLCPSHLPFSASSLSRRRSGRVWFAAHFHDSSVWCRGRVGSAHTSDTNTPALLRRPVRFFFMGCLALRFERTGAPRILLFGQGDRAIARDRRLDWPGHCI